MDVKNTLWFCMFFLFCFDMSQNISGWPGCPGSHDPTTRWSSRVSRALPSSSSHRASWKFLSKMHRERRNELETSVFVCLERPWYAVIGLERAGWLFQLPISSYKEFRSTFKVKFWSWCFLCLIQAGFTSLPQATQTRAAVDVASFKVRSMAKNSYIGVLAVVVMGRAVRFWHDLAVP